MDKWPLGVFSNIAAFGVQLDVARELEVPTIYLHCPSVDMRTQVIADDFRRRSTRWATPSH